MLHLYWFKVVFYIHFWFLFIQAYITLPLFFLFFFFTIVFYCIFKNISSTNTFFHSSFILYSNPTVTHLLACSVINLFIFSLLVLCINLFFFSLGSFSLRSLHFFAYLLQLWLVKTEQTSPFRALTSDVYMLSLYIYGFGVHYKQVVSEEI